MIPLVFKAMVPIEVAVKGIEISLKLKINLEEQKEPVLELQEDSTKNLSKKSFKYRKIMSKRQAIISEEQKKQKDEK